MIGQLAKNHIPAIKFKTDQMLSYKGAFYQSLVFVISYMNGPDRDYFLIAKDLPCLHTRKYYLQTRKLPPAKTFVAFLYP